MTPLLRLKYAGEWPDHDAITQGIVNQNLLAVATARPRHAELLLKNVTPYQCYPCQLGGRITKPLVIEVVKCSNILQRAEELTLKWHVRKRTPVLAKLSACGDHSGHLGIGCGSRVHVAER